MKRRAFSSIAGVLLTLALPLSAACGGDDDVDTSAERPTLTTNATVTTGAIEASPTSGEAESGDAITDAEVSELEQQLDDIEKVLDELDTELSQD